MSIRDIVNTEFFMHTEERAAFASKRRDAYKMLSACFYLPEQDTLEQLADLQAAFDLVCLDAVEYIAAMRQQTDLEELSIDFSKLFVGPFRLLAPPYGSVYLEGERAVMGASTLDARNRYREAGLDFSDNVKIEHNAKTDFYKNLAGAANGFVRHDINHVVAAVQAYAKP